MRQRRRESTGGVRPDVSNHSSELTSSLSLKAADISIKMGIAMADAIVAATASDCGAQILTSDQHFKKIDTVKFVT
jgi:predicted nucleic acid-binding protein